LIDITTTFAVISWKKEAYRIMIADKIKNARTILYYINETITETAKRELQEETGAVDFEIKPICVYSVKGKTRVNENIDDETFGMLFVADITSFENINSEIEKIIIVDELVDNWTYPLIQPKLIAEAKKRGYI